MLQELAKVEDLVWKGAEQLHVLSAEMTESCTASLTALEAVAGQDIKFHGSEPCSEDMDLLPDVVPTDITSKLSWLQNFDPFAQQQPADMQNPLSRYTLQTLNMPNHNNRASDPCTIR